MQQFWKRDKRSYKSLEAVLSSAKSVTYLESSRTIWYYQLRERGSIHGFNLCEVYALKKSRSRVCKKYVLRGRELIYNQNRNQRASHSTSTNLLLTNHKEKGDSQLKLSRKQTVLHLYVRRMGTIIELETAEDRENLVPVTGVR